MSIFEPKNEKIKLSHPFYKIMDLDKVSLENTLLSWSREKLIEWLVWNDRNGVYRDDESMSEIGEILQKDGAIEIIMNQLSEYWGKLEVSDAK